MKRSSVFLSVFLLAAGCSSGGDGVEEERFASAVSREMMRAIPETLGDRLCKSPVAFNDRWEVILQCWKASEKEFAFRDEVYALWSGGSSLQDLREARAFPDLAPDEHFIPLAISNDGAVFGSVGSIGDGSFAPTRGIRADKKSFIEYPAPLEKVSPNGKYVLTSKFVEGADGFFTFEPLLYEGQKLVSLAPFPSGVAGLESPPTDVRDDGTVAGAVLVASPGQSFSASYGYLRSAKSFTLIPPPGRPGLANVSWVNINNRGSAVLEYLSNTTYSVNYPDGTVLDQSVENSAFIGKDGATVEITFGNPSVSVHVNGINDNDIVHGSYDNQTASDLKPFGSYIFSPRAGFTKLEDIFPGADTASVFGVNKNNEALIQSEAGNVIMPLPKGF